MARRPRQGPSLRLHRSGNYFVRVRGRDFYLGRDETEANDRRFKVLADLADGKVPPIKRRTTTGPPPQPQPTGGLTVAELVDCFVAKMVPDTEYGRECTIELRRFAAQLGKLLPANDVSKRHLAAYKDRLLKAGKARSTINRRVALVRRLFRWAAENELVDDVVVVRLQHVSEVKPGQAPEKRGRKVPWPDVRAVLRVLPEHYRAMVLVLLTTGMRIGELCQMRRRDIQIRRQDGRWIYHVPTHKTQRFGEAKTVAIFPLAQRILTRFMPLDPDLRIFRPEDIVDAKRAALRAARRSPMTPSQTERDRDRRENPRARRRAIIDPTIFRHAIERACRQAGVAYWNPHRLRHTAGIRLRALYGADVTQAQLGHKTRAMTDHYTPLDAEFVIRQTRRRQA